MFFTLFNKKIRYNAYKQTGLNGVSASEGLYQVRMLLP